MGFELLIRLFPWSSMMSAKQSSRNMQNRLKHAQLYQKSGRKLPNSLALDGAFITPRVP